jgi:hypothetical protein
MRISATSDFPAPVGAEYTRLPPPAGPGCIRQSTCHANSRCTPSVPKPSRSASLASQYPMSAHAAGCCGAGRWRGGGAASGDGTATDGACKRGGDFGRGASALAGTKLGKPAGGAGGDWGVEMFARTHDGIESLKSHGVRACCEQRPGDDARGVLTTVKMPCKESWSTAFLSTADSAATRSPSKEFSAVSESPHLWYVTQVITQRRTRALTGDLDAEL